MNRSVQYRIKRPLNKGGRWVVTRIEMTDVGLVRVHGVGATQRDARVDAGEKHSKVLDRMRRRASRPTSQFTDEV